MKLDKIICFYEPADTTMRSPYNAGIKATFDGRTYGITGQAESMPTLKQWREAFKQVKEIAAKK